MNPNRHFVFEMVSDQIKRNLIFDSSLGTLTWQDTQHNFLSSDLLQKIPPTAPDRFSPQPFNVDQPVGKSKDLRLLKIQVGYGCNFSCSFCSQSSTRSGIRTEKLSPHTQGLFEKLQSLLRNHSAIENLRIEFWGGETLIYWPTVQALAQKIRSQWPAVQLLLFTNGSLLTPAIVESLIQLQIHVVISHEGLKQIEMRGRAVPDSAKELIRSLHQSLFPKGLLSFNMTLGKSNFEIKKTRSYLSQYFQIPLHQVYLNFDVLMVFDKMSGRFHIHDSTERLSFTQSMYQELKSLGLESHWIPFLKSNIFDFLSFLAHPHQSKSLFQKCSMDRPDSLAIDMEGNVLTCQNTTKASGHKIGHLDQFEEIALHTSTHWSHRASCQNCPVLALCRGSCMYLQDELFHQTCDNYFAFYSALLAFILQDLSGFELRSIQGHNIRNKNIQSVQILEPL